MDAKTLAALRRSIESWEHRVLAGEAYSGPVGSDACPLCQIYIRYDCEGCPVAQRTSRDQCFGTPYYDWRFLFVSSSPPNSDVDRSAELSKRAQAEVDFLKSLLPEDAQAIVTEGQDPQGLGAEPESTVAIGDAPGGLSDV